MQIKGKSYYNNCWQNGWQHACFVIKESQPKQRSQLIGISYNIVPRNTRNDRQKVLPIVTKIMGVTLQTEQQELIL